VSSASRILTDRSLVLSEPRAVGAQGSTKVFATSSLGSCLVFVSSAVVTVASVLATLAVFIIEPARHIDFIPRDGPVLCPQSAGRQGRKETMTNEDQPIGRRRKPMKIRTIIVATCAAFFSMAGPIHAHDSKAQTLTKKFEAAIPNIPGKSLIAVEVDYAPGAASVPHTHAKSAFIYAYVISGAIESKVNDGETRYYHAGEGWSEPPGAAHSVSRNASKTRPAKLLAVFVLDTNDNPLTTPIK
jgi:quercetin dioxygenase-like cupin family protein